METRGQFCRACDQITSGDCGMHGPRIIGPILQAPFSPTVQTTPAQSTSETTTAREIVEWLRIPHVKGTHLCVDCLACQGEDIIQDALDAAVRAERERCAKFIEETVYSYSEYSAAAKVYSVGSGKGLAAAIRAPEA